MKPSLKSVSLPITTVILLLVVYLPSLGTNELGEVKALTLEIKELSALMAMLIFTVLLSSMISENIRDSLIFTRCKHVLPSSRIKQLLSKDHRFGISFIAKNLSEIDQAETPEEEHDAWWGMYKSQKDATEVKNRHLWYLSLRDAFSASLILTTYSILVLFLPLPGILLGGWKYHLAATLVIMISARQNGNRMATNVVSAHFSGN